MGAISTLTGGVEVWHLDLAAGNSSRYERFLVPDERERAERYRQRETRDAFVLTRATLRCLLGDYLAVDPLSIRFTFNQHGKPRLSGSEENQGLVFSVSHSGHTALLAFAQNVALGVDTERLRSRRGLDDLARHCLSESEWNAWSNALPMHRLDTFIRYWVCKEAFVKAAGRGIALGLNQVEVRDDFKGFLSVPDEWGSAEDWRLHEWGDGGNRCALACLSGEKNIGVSKRIATALLDWRDLGPI